MQKTRQACSNLNAHLLSVVLMLVCSGCRQGDRSFEIVSLEGSIEKIDVNSDETGRITVSYYSEKYHRDTSGTGLVTRETEIMINGAVARLADLREGDRVRGEVRVDREHGEKRQIVLKIYVDRPLPIGDRE